VEDVCQSFGNWVGGGGVKGMQEKGEIAEEAAYRRYIEKTSAIIGDTMNRLQCQPVFFIGSGFSKRYIGTPSWMELLQKIAIRAGLSESEFSYIAQKNSNNAIDIGQELHNIVFEWAWKKGKSKFPKDYFGANHSPSSFIKYLVCDELKSLMPTKSKLQKLLDLEEISLLKNTSPHAIITTNYDGLLEAIFDGYEPIIGEKVIRYNLNMVGEIFKIHGSVDDATSIVLTRDDYQNYTQKKKYISAKLLTYLAEHPVFVFGYGFNDPNVNQIIEDVGEIIGGESRSIENIFYVKWQENSKSGLDLREEYVLGSGEKQYRVRAITTSEFSWIFKALSQQREIGSINTRVLRAMAARVYKLIRTDIPKRQFEVNYETLEGVINEDAELPKLLGFVEANNFNLTHPLVLTQVGQKLGYPGWHGARKLIERINKEKGVNIFDSDNRYHCAIKTGPKSMSHKYSNELVKVLEAAKEGAEYKLKV
jgi:hypothetical protein